VRLLKQAMMAVVACACAQSGMPPGGPPDTDPPVLLHVSPDSGRTRVKPRAVVFQFDEVINEVPKGGDLASLVIISPGDGRPEVGWARTAMTVHPRHGWRDNTAYVVTVLPGISDLRGNAIKDPTVIVFSTGAAIPDTRIGGVVFDWTKATPVPRAYVEAHPAGDTTLVFATESDSVGRFALPFLAPATYVVRALIDANHNRKLDLRELWDSSVVTLHDTANVELYSFVHDTLGPRISGATVADSLTLRVTFDQPLWPDSAYTPAIALRAADSSAIPLAAVRPWATLADARAKVARQRTDSIARADTSAKARASRARFVEDSLNRAATIADSLARDTTKRVPPPVAKRPALLTDFAVQLQRPLPADAHYQLEAVAKGVLGATRTSRRTFTVPKPPEPKKDTTAVKKDTTAARKDSTAKKDSTVRPVKTDTMTARPAREARTRPQPRPPLK
jgi:hypothetical protein